MNSIVSNLTKENVISELYLLIYHPSRTELFIVVEGITDIKFLNRYFNNVTLIESYSGKKGVIEIINTINDNSVIGICDNDYKKVVNSNIFYYDYNSLETMLVTNESVFKSVIKEYIFHDNEIEKFKKKVIEYTKPISILMEQSAVNNWRLKLDPIKPNDYYISDHFKLEALNNKVCLLNNGFDISQTNYISYNNPNFPATNLHGHTIMWTISYLLPKTLSIDTVDSLFRCSYGKAEFNKTKLLTELINHFTLHKLNIQEIMA